VLTQGCAYTAVSSTASFVITGKSLSDHALSTLTQSDCDSYNWAVQKQDYVCEQARTPDTHYNRTSY